MKPNSTNQARFALKGVVLASAMLWGSHAAALGLGRLTVLSALGEALRAEVEVTNITPEEAATLALRVAPPEAYRAAGVEYNPVLPGSSVQVVKRPDGRSVLRITSDRAVLEPFVDVIIEANWASGRLVREYTMLFDPPGSRTAAAPAAPGTAPVASSGTAAVASPVVPRPAPEAQALAPAAAAAARARPATAPAPAAAAAADGGAEADRYRVKEGDTLSRIAGRTQRPGVSLDQMLVGLFRSNADAFVGDNMNRLKAGTVLKVPSAAEAQSVSVENARELIATQSADFAAYRQRLAAGTTTAADAEASRVAKGKVQTTVDDRKQATATTPDRLTLTRPGAAGATPEAAVSKETERKANESRLAELARNVEELKKLQGGATQAAKPAAPAAAAAPSPAPVTAAAPTPAPAPAPAAAPPATLPAPTVVAAAPPPPPPAPAPAPAPVAEAPAPAPVAVAEAPAPVVPPPAAPKVAAPPPVVEAESRGFVDSIKGNAFALPALGALAALMAVFGLWRVYGRSRKPAGETSFLESRLQPDSFFGASGGQRVDTNDAAAGAPASSSMSYSLSQLDAIGDVDPVAEADVYLAYGRDLQAEEILKEAMRATPERLAIRTKLLEVYAKRRDAKSYELLAAQVYNLTRGTGDDWARVQAQGLTIDPDNQLYKPGGAPEEVRGNSGDVVEALGASTMPYTAPVSNAFQPAPDATLDGPDLNLDLDLSSPAAPVSRMEATQPLGPNVRLGERSGVDFDLGEAMPSAAPSRTDLPKGTIAAAGVLASAAGLATQVKAAPAAVAKAVDDLDFDLGSLDAEGPATAVLPTDTNVDFGDFDLDAPAPGDGSDGDPLARKLELADEFRQIGDLEGARDLLEEVLAKATGTLKTKAQTMLSQLG